MHEGNGSTIALPESESPDVLTGILRRGARKLLAEAVEAVLYFKKNPLVAKSYAERAYEAVQGYALPGFQNCHSHAFQYAMAALAENQYGGQCGEPALLLFRNLCGSKQ